MTHIGGPAADTGPGVDIITAALILRARQGRRRHRIRPAPGFRGGGTCRLARTSTLQCAGSPQCGATRDLAATLNGLRRRFKRDCKEETDMKTSAISSIILICAAAVLGGCSPGGGGGPTPVTPAGLQQLSPLVGTWTGKSKAEETQGLAGLAMAVAGDQLVGPCSLTLNADRKSTRLNSSHVRISYAVFCLKKKNHTHDGRGGNGVGYSGVDLLPGCLIYGAHDGAVVSHLFFF